MLETEIDFKSESCKLRLPNGPLSYPLLLVDILSWLHCYKGPSINYDVSVVGVGGPRGVAPKTIY